MVGNTRKTMRWGLMPLVAALMLLCGCTQNNGHLGPLFGSWALDEITRDGMPVELGDETVFSFQNEIVRVVRYVNPPYYTVTRYGNFTHEGDELTLRYQSEPTSTANRGYMAPDWLYFPKGADTLAFKIKKLTGGEMVLLLDSDDAEMEYRFRKTW